MTVTVRDPFLTEPFRLFDYAFGRLLGNGGSRVTGWLPMLDVSETEDEYVVLLDLPGVKPQDVTIELEKQLLTVSGTRVPPATGEAKYAERPYGSFVRTLTLPQGIDEDGITAHFDEGVLTLRVPKLADVKPKKIAIGAGSKKALAR